MRKILASLMVMGVALVAATSANATKDKITICHVAGLASDPANYITLNLPPQAVYGNGGHFNENGTTQAGHEQDTFGACNPPTPTPEPTPEPTPVPTPVPPVERCEPPNPDGTYGGKDGKPGNDECVADPVPPTSITPPTTTGSPAVTPPVVSIPTTPVKEEEKKVEKKEKRAEKKTVKTEPKTTPKPDNPPVKSGAVKAETLPYTGFETWMAALAGLALIGAGGVMRRLGS